jgi:hypothetical protein
VKGSPDLHRNAALVLPLLLVNTAAIYGQSGWAHDHLGHNWTVAILFALAVESIGVFLAAEAHAALMAGHASGALRLGSYAVGALVGALNFAHYATQPHYRPNPLAVTFGLLSSISPWLWAIRSRSMNRDRLAAMGLVDPRAVKFSRLRWALFPIRTFTAFRAAVWAGITRPDEAVSAADQRRSRTPDPAVAPTDGVAPLGLPGVGYLAREGQDPVRVRAFLLDKPEAEQFMAGTDVAALGASVTPDPDPVLVDATPAVNTSPDPAPAVAEPAPPRAPRRRPATPKRQPSAAERVAKAIARSPKASDATIAARLGLSEATVRRHRRQAVDSVSTGSAPNLRAV